MACGSACRLLFIIPRTRVINHELVQAAKIAVSNSVDLLRRCRIVSAFSEGLEEGREGLRCVQSAGGPERDRALGGEGGGGRFIPSQRSVAEEDPERDRATRVEQEQQRERERERETLLGINVQNGGSWARSGDRRCILERLGRRRRRPCLSCRGSLEDNRVSPCEQLVVLVIAPCVCVECCHGVVTVCAILFVAPR